MLTRDCSESSSWPQAHRGLSRRIHSASSVLRQVEYQFSTRFCIGLDMVATPETKFPSFPPVLPLSICNNNSIWFFKMILVFLSMFSCPEGQGYLTSDSPSR